MYKSDAEERVSLESDPLGLGALICDMGVMITLSNYLTGEG